MRSDDWLAHQLPVGMTDDDFLMRFLKIFQNLSDTVLHQVDALPHMFDPTVAPDTMVRAMAEWFGVDWVDSSLDDRLQREIVMQYSELIRWRGTKRGLLQLMELLSGGECEVHDSGGVFAEGESPGGPDHLRLVMPSGGWNHVEDLITIIRAEVPATATFDLWVGGEKVWPPLAAATASSGHLPGVAPEHDHSAHENAGRGVDDA